MFYVDRCISHRRIRKIHSVHISEVNVYTHIYTHIYVPHHTLSNDKETFIQVFLENFEKIVKKCLLLYAQWCMYVVGSNFNYTILCYPYPMERCINDVIRFNIVLKHIWINMFTIIALYLTLCLTLSLDFFIKTGQWAI